MGATSGMTITIYDSTGQEQITNNLKFSSGLIVSSEEESLLSKVKTTSSKILSTDYDITGFDDSLSLQKKLSSAHTILDSLKDELSEIKSAKKSDEKQVTINQNKINAGTSDSETLSTITKLNSEIDNYESLITKLNTEIENYTLFINELEQNGEYRILESLESVGDQSLEEEVDLDNLNLADAPTTGIASNVTEAVATYMETMVQSLIAGGAMNLLNSMGLNQENLDMALKIVDMANSAVFKINCIIKFVPSNISMSPSPKYCLNLILTSLKDMFMASYNAVEVKFHETYDEAITNLPSAEEVLADAQDLLMASIEKIIDEQCVKYTGHTSVELYFMCTSYIAKYKEWKAARKAKREAAENAEDSGVVTTSGTSTSKGITTHVEVDTDAIKQEFLDMLKDSSDLIYNSFFIILIKDTIDQIKDLVHQFHNIDLKVLTEGINSFDDFINLCDELGLSDDSPSMIISLKDAIKNGINELAGDLNGIASQMEAQALSTALDVADLLQKNTTISSTSEKIFDFTIDTNNLAMTLTIYQNPTINKNRKMINNALSNATKKDKSKIFDTSDVASIMNNIINYYSKGEDIVMELQSFTFTIHFEIEGNSTDVSDDEVSQVEKYLKDAEEKAEADLQNTDVYELGIVEEEYTLDPVEAARRPTLDIIHTIFSILKEILPLMKLLAELISNYKTNKAYAESMAEGNLFATIAAIAKLRNLFKHTNTTKQNFFTIRSMKLYNYVVLNILNPGKDIEMILNLENTRKLYLYLKANNANYSRIDLTLETVVYIDQDSLNDQKNKMNDELNKAGNYFGDDAALFIDYPDSKYPDGSLDGLDKIEIAGDDIYYTDSSLPMYGSQILYCFGAGYDENI